MKVAELRKLLGSKLEEALGDYGFVRPSKKSYKLTLDGEDLHTEIRWFADHDKSFTELARVSINYSLRSESLFEFAAKFYEPTIFLFDAYCDKDYLFHSQVQYFFDSERWPDLDFQKRAGLPKLIDDYVAKFADTITKH